MDEERDLITFTDEDGSEVTMEVVDYFYYNGDEYAVLTDADNADADLDDPAEIFFMKVLPVADNDEEVEFEPVEDEELAAKLFEVITSEMDEDEE